MQIIAKSEVGNVRKINQDYVVYKSLNNNETIAVLCDGMGGHKAGEVASLMTCEYILNHFENHAPFQNDEDIQSWISEMIVNANKLLMKESSLHEEYEGMGTTVVLCYVKDEDFYISHVGDSRAYYLNETGLNQLTRDDTLVNALVAYGSITELEAMSHPRKNILLQAVGATEELKISFYKQKFEKGLLLLCSDGLTNSLSDQQITDILTHDFNKDIVANELVSQSLVHGGYDNISFIILDKGVFTNE